MSLGFASRIARVLVLGAVLACASLASPPAQAQSDDVKQRAREHFDRGLRLFDQSDDKGALAEFRAAYELVPHPSVLYSIGLVYASLGRPVEAVDSLERLLAQSPRLAPEQLERAKATLAAEQAKVGSLNVTTNVPATVELDGVDGGKTPLAKPLRVASGIRLVSVVAPGHVPIRREVSVAGGQLVTLSLELQKSEQDLAQFDLSIDVPDAEVLVDGERIGKSPLPASLALLPGRRAVEVRRPGYRPFRQTLDVTPGSRGRLAVALEADEAEVARSGGTLSLDPSEEQTVAFLDGKPQTGHGPFRLAPGRHRLRIEKGEFFPIDREVTIESGRHTVLKVAIHPTPEKRAKYVDAATSHRTTSWIVTGAGAAVAAGVGGVFIWQYAKMNNEDDAYWEKKAECETYTNASPQRIQCVREADGRLEKYSNTRTKVWIYGGIAGAGLVVTGVGLSMLLSGDDPHRYDLKPESDVFGKLRLSPVATPRGDVGLWATGTF